MTGPSEPADEARLRAQLEATRERVSETAQALQRRLHDTWDPATWVRRHPGITLGLAFGVGLALGIRRR